MGLLDALTSSSIDDPKSQAVMGLAMGLLSGRGSDGFAKGIQGAMQGYQNAKQSKWQDELMQFKRAEMASQTDALKRKNDFGSLMQGLLNGNAPQINGKPVDMEALSVGPEMPDTPRYEVPKAAPKAQLGELLQKPEFLLAAKNAGFDLTEIAKFAKPNISVHNNVAYDMNSLKPGQIIEGSQVTPQGQGISIRNNGGTATMSAMPGSLETLAAFEEQKKRIENRNTPLPLGYVGADTNAPIGGSIDAYLQGQQPAPQQVQPRPQVGGNTSNITTQAIEAIARDAAANGIQNPTARFEAPAGSRLNVNIPQTPMGQPQPAPMQPPRLQSAAQAKASEEQAVLPAKAQGEINTNWIKSTLQPTIAGGESASSVLTNVTVARSALGAIGQTGWGTEAKATAASVLAGLGVAPENAKMFASNVQTFQNVAMTNLKTQLDAAAGPQTEGDADRASKLFASLKNTPQSNAFILDLMEAKAQRDAAKAKFYQGSLPIAQKQGDFSLIDREWSTRAPSVFDMPSMKKWNIK